MDDYSKFSDKEFYKNRLVQFSEELRDQHLEKRGKIRPNSDRKYVIYVRKSTQGEDKQLKSIESQLHECQEYAKRQGLKVVQVLSETKSAKTSGNRPIFSEMLDIIREGKSYNSIIAWSVDRLARNMKEGGEIVDMLDKGIIADLQFPSFIFTNDSNGKLTLGIQFTLAKQYSENLSSHVNRQISKDSSEGKAKGRKKWGYKNTDEGYFRRDPKSFNIVKKIWDLGIQGRPAAIIYEAVKGFSEMDNMQEKTISRVLADPFYAGILVMGEHVIDLTEKDKGFEPIITPEQFFTVRTNAKELKSHFRERQYENVPYKGLIYCSFCKRIMNVSPSEGRTQRYLYARCRNKKCTRSKDQLKKGMRVGIINNFVVDLIGKMRTTKADYDKAMKYINTNLIIRITEINTELKKLKVDHLKHDRAHNTILGVLSSNNSKENASLLINKLNSEAQIIDAIVIKKRELETALTEIKATINENKVPYKDFANFFEMVQEVMSKTNNGTLLADTVKLVFANLYIDDEKVVNYELQEPFRSFEHLKKDIWGQLLDSFMNRSIDFIININNVRKLLSLDTLNYDE